jgi:hypothetical protein
MTEYSVKRKLTAIRRRLKSRLIWHQKRKRYLFDKLVKRKVYPGLSAKTMFSNKVGWALSYTHTVERACPNRFFINEIVLKIRLTEKYPHCFGLKRTIDVTSGVVYRPVRMGSLGGRRSLIFSDPITDSFSASSAV